MAQVHLNVPMECNPTLIPFQNTCMFFGLGKILVA